MISAVSAVGVVGFVALATGIALFAFADEPQTSNRGEEPATASRDDGATLPNPGFTIDANTTAPVVTDPQNDFLSPTGVAWGVVGKSVTKNRTFENLTDLFRAAKDADIPAFISPHYYYPLDHRWHFEGALEKLMHDIHMFDRRGQLEIERFAGSGADWLELYKPFVNDGKTVVTRPHKLYGPQSNDLVLQLRKRGVNKVLGGPERLRFHPALPSVSGSAPQSLARTGMLLLGIVDVETRGPDPEADRD
jgi:nicotinamidase-related amidase